MDRQLELEFWVDVPGYEGLYEVSSLGRVRSLNYKRTEHVRVLKPYKNSIGYLRIDLCKDGKQEHYLVHRLVWTAFVGQIPENYELDHYNTKRCDNRLSNLRVCTPKENRNNPITKVKHFESIRKALSKRVVQLDKQTGEVIRIWDCARDVERELGIWASQISLCCNMKKGFETAGGFKWCFFMPPVCLFKRRFKD